MGYSELQVAVAELHKALKENMDHDDIVRRIDTVYANITQLKQDGPVINYKDKMHKNVSLIRVPVATTDASYYRSNDWVASAVQINGKGDTDSSSRRIMRQLIKNNPNSAHAALEKEAHAALEKEGMKVMKQMNETKLAAMFKDGNLNDTQQRKVLKHLRDHLGKKAFESIAKVKMFGEGATPVTSGSIQYSYEEGDDGVKETIEYYEKNIALEIGKQLGYALTNSNKSAVNIKRVDVIAGGDHGCGAFVAGAKVVVTFSDKSSVYFDVSVAEVLCRKDNAEVLEKTILTELTKGLKTMAENEMHIIRKKNGDYDCVFGKMCDVAATLEEGDIIVKALKVHLYVTGDLAFYAMVLGKEGMSGHWCHLCKISRKDFDNLAMEGELWTTKAMIETAKEVAESDSKKPKHGVKTKLWWPFIDIQNYVVPLLHTLIGIGNDILDNLKDIVNDKIERITKTEHNARASLATVDATIKSLVAERDSFDESAAGKELKSLRRKIKAREKALKQLGVGNGEGDEEEDFEHMSNDELINEVDAFVVESDAGNLEDNEEESNEEEEDNIDVDGNAVEAEGDDVTPDKNDNNDGNTALTQKIKQLEEELRKLSADAKARQKQRDTIATRLKKARAFSTRLKERLTSMRSERRRKDGMEAKMEEVLKKVNVEIQRYHGGSLTGKDILKVVANATFIFDEFAKIFKEFKREDCVLEDSDITKLCEEHKLVFLLWDGAFSCARTINPKEQDVKMYKRFVDAAVFCHMKIGCSVTPKVHLMLKHVVQQMKSFPGGLGDKMEDWVELMHQTGQRLRVRFRTVKCVRKRAKAMARTIQLDSNPAINKQIGGVADRASRGSYSKNKDSTSEGKEERRIAALTAFERGDAVICK